MASAAQTFAPGTGTNAAPQSAAMRARPFCQASQFGVEQGNVFSPGLQSVNTQTYGPNPLPATGYIRRVRLTTQLAAGAAGTFTAGGDAPWNVFNLVRFAEPNAAPVVELSGYNLYLSNLFGGYAGWDDPANDWDFSGTSPNINIEPYVPVELDMTGMGALSNLSNASAFRLTVIAEASSNIYSTAPTTFPSITVVPHIDYWTLPNSVDMDGNPQATAPPYPGTIQLWSQITNLGLAQGNNRTALNRMGNQLRTVIMVTRVAGLRSEAPFPNPASLRWDDINMRIESPQSLRKWMKEFLIMTNPRNTYLTGVYCYPYSNGITRETGGNGISSFLPTVTATRYELSGSTGTAGTLDWVINDVSSAPVSGLQRATVGGGQGFYPPNAQPAGGTQ
jgi:hypothetical protein